MKWRIIDGPITPTAPERISGQTRTWIVESTARPAERHPVSVVLTEDALAMLDPPADVRAAIDDDGRTAVELFLDEREPPELLLVTTTGIRPGAPGQ